MIVFTHIPKTAGSTVSASIAELLQPRQMHIFTRGDAGLKDVEALDLAPLRFVTGHLRFPDAHAVIGKARYLVAIRHPLARALSHYFFALRAGTWQPQSDIRSDFLRFHRSAAAMLWNISCRYLAQSGRAADAIDNILGHYTLVWNNERTDIALPQIIEVAAADLAADPPARPVSPVERKMVAPTARTETELQGGARPERYEDFLSRDEVAEILADNAEDMRLFRWLRRQGDVLRLLD